MDSMMTPQALKQMMDLGIMPGVSARCSHREGFSREHSVQCSESGIVICGGCGAATCTQPFHIYCRFVTTRDGDLLSTTGSKFYYRCEECSNFLCARCLGIADEYPCPPEQLERYSFSCPRCQGDVSIYRVDGVDMTGAAEQLVQHPSAMLRFGS